MSTENKDVIFHNRGGCLDTFIQIVSLGSLGVETTTVLPKRRLPLPSDVKVGDTIQQTPNMAVWDLFQPQSGEKNEPGVVIINDFTTINTPKVTRKIVRNR